LCLIGIEAIFGLNDWAIVPTRPVGKIMGFLSFNQASEKDNLICILSIFFELNNLSFNNFI
jgi:hypothetical protein